MIESFIHTSQNNNFYIYDDHSRLSMLVHPEIRKVHEKSTDVDSFYLQKYEYLRKHGFFAKPKVSNFETLSEETVKTSIIETQGITFEVTDFCNLNCTYCAYGELYEGFDTRSQKDISIRSAKKLLKYIFEFKSKNKNLSIGFYGGEPLLNMNFIKQIVEASDQLNVEKEMIISFTITTNATLLHKYIHFFVANKFLLFISLDGNEENHSYRVYRKNKKNSFQKVIENIDMIQREYPEYFATHVDFITVFHNRNSVKDIYEYIYTRYHKIPQISELALDDVKPDKKNIVESMYHSRKKSEDEYKKEESNLLPKPYYNYELADFLKFFSINFYVSHITALLYDEGKILPTSTCLPFSKNIFLTNRNNILPCEKINYKYTLGKVDKDVMIDIPEITRQYNHYYDHLKKICQHCYAYRFCGVCMFHIEKFDKLDTEEFVCENFCDQKAFQNKLYRLVSFLEKHRIDIFQILELENIKTE